MIGSRLLILMFVAAGTAYGLPSNWLVKKYSSNDNSQHLGIYNGKNTTIEKYPHQVSMIIYAVDYIFCAASILTKRWCITTADCAMGFFQSDMTIVAGSTDGKSGQKYSVEKIVPHPKYNELDYNMALIKIKGSFTWSSTVQPVKITSNCPQPETVLSVAGWGDTGSKQSGEQETNGIFKEANMTMKSNDYCEKAYSKYNVTFTDRMGCAYGKHKETLCLGDMGDGFVARSKKGDKEIPILYYMYISSGYTGFCTSKAKPSVLTNVCSEVPWVIKIIGAEIYDEDSV